MQPEQYVLLDMIYAKSQELEAELKPQPASRKHLENAVARQYGRLVGRGQEVAKTTVQPAKLATDSGIFRIG